MPRKTDSNNPADWLFIARADLDGLQELATKELAYSLCRSKLSEVLEKVIKAELIRLGWPLLKTHDLLVLAVHLEERKSTQLEVAKPLCFALAEAYFTDRYPGFDLEDADWPKIRAQIQQIERLLNAVKSNLPASTN